MAVSVFDLFTVGIGPSSSHTVGPMRATRTFVEALREQDRLSTVDRVQVELFGSLAFTGRGHGTDGAVMIGLEGAEPETVDPETIRPRVDAITEDCRLTLGGVHPIPFHVKRDIRFEKRQRLPLHSNGIRCTAFDQEAHPLDTRTYYSVGGGFVVSENDEGVATNTEADPDVRWPFRSGDELLRLGAEHNLRLSELMMHNEQAWRPEPHVRAGLLGIWTVMRECVERGCRREDRLLPGTLKVERRAPALYRSLTDRSHPPDPLDPLDWVNLWALAVNEENATGGRVVTAPTNGAAGIIPAVLHYYLRFIPGADDDGVVRFLLAAGAIGRLYKENASISGAEAGCQGEVGVACSMAAGGLVEAQGGTMEQVEQAAEIGMEHNLGLTCDPVGGLVQIPCIERNAMGAVKAINAARMALRGDGTHLVSLDKVIRTMHQTGLDMKTKYKETARGGLAVNVVEC